MLSSVLRGLRIYIAVCCPSVLCYTEKPSSDVNGRLTTVKTTGTAAGHICLHSDMEIIEMLFMVLCSS